jgi:hypothetical protein
VIAVVTLLAGVALLGVVALLAVIAESRRWQRPPEPR